MANGIFKKKDEFGSGVKLVNVYDLFRDEEIKFSELERVKATDSELKSFGVERGDVFFCRSSLKLEGVAWGCWISEVPEPTVYECHIIRAKIKEDLALPAFISYYSKTKYARKYLLAKSNVTTMATIDQNAIENLPIPLPPLSTQEKLVEAMEQARAERKRKLQEADDLLNSLDGWLLDQLDITPPPEDNRKVFAVKLSQITNERIDSAFYSPKFVKIQEELTKLNERLKLSNCGVERLFSQLHFPPLNGFDSRKYVDIGQRYLRVQNIKPYQIDTTDAKYIETTHSKDIQLLVDDVLLTRKGTYGVSAIVTEENKYDMISSEVILLRLKQDANILPFYLVCWLNSSFAKSLFERYKTGGIMGHITQDVVKNFPVPIVDKNLQQEIVKKFYFVREEANSLKRNAEADWQNAKDWFEAQLLGGNE